MLKIKRLKEDDDRFGHKKGDLVLVETKYDWDPEKCICIGTIIIDNEHSFYNDELISVTDEEIKGLRKLK